MAGTCPVCGGTVAARTRGRPRDYCSRACQAKAYRARQAAEPPDVEVVRARELADQLGQAARALSGLVSAGPVGADALRVVEANAREALAELVALAREATGTTAVEAPKVEAVPAATVIPSTPVTEPAAPERDETPVTESAEREERERQAERERERAQFEQRLRPIGLGDLGDGYEMAEWPGTGRYYLHLHGERIGHVTKTTYGTQWEAYTAHGTRLGDRKFKTRRDALVEVALHHRHSAPKTRRKRRDAR